MSQTEKQVETEYVIRKRDTGEMWADDFCSVEQAEKFLKDHFRNKLLDIRDYYVEERG